ncbi:hypothetical protein V8E53_003122, partial [Lactarius tabidus]
MSTSRLSASPSPSTEAELSAALPESVGSPAVSDDSGPVTAAAEQEPAPAASTGSKRPCSPDGDDIVEAE